MDFLTYYGLTEQPFRITPDAGYFFASRSHHNALLSLEYSTDHREGFCLVVGEPGTGKTTLLNVFLEKYQDKAEIAMVLTPRLSPQEFLLAILEDFGVQCGAENKNEIIRTFRDFLLQKSLEGKSVIILVDESQDLSDETLEELRLLSNLETEKEKLLQIILVGQPEIAARLKSTQLRQLGQRIVTRINLSPLNVKEVREYISFRLTKAGRGHVRFRDAAIRKIYHHSKGIPRLINTITTRTLMSAFLQEAGEIQPSHVQYAARSLKFEKESFMKKFMIRPAFVTALALVVAFCLVSPGVIESYFDRTAPDKNTWVNIGRIKKSAHEAKKPVLRASIKKVNKKDHRAPKDPNHDVQYSGDLLTAFVTPYAANVRETPGIKGYMIDVVYRGEELTLLNELAEVDGVFWYRLDPDRWSSGWISSRVISVVDQQ